MKNNKFVLFAWCADDEGGYGTCLAEKFSSNTGYNPKSGWRAKPSIEIGRFNTVEELANLIYNDSPEYYTAETAMDEARPLFDIEVLEQLDSNNQYELTELTEEEYNELKK